MPTLTFISRLMNFPNLSVLFQMGSSTSSSSSSSSCNNHENPNIEANERFHFRFTDCSCQCNANKKRAIGVGGGRENHDLPQVPFMNAFLTPINRSQYDIRELFSTIFSRSKIKIL